MVSSFSACLSGAIPQRHGPLMRRLPPPRMGPDHQDAVAGGPGWSGLTVAPGGICSLRGGGQCGLF
jgi:hypothetical protein